MKKTSSEEDETDSSKIKKLESDMVIRILKEIHLLDGHPRLQIFVTHGFLELMTSALIKSKTKNSKKILDDNRSFPYATQILILNELGVISQKQYELYDYFRKIRNKAAHEPLFELKEEHIKFLGGETETDFQMICSKLMGTLWNDHIEILGPLFIPTLFNKK